MTGEEMTKRAREVFDIEIEGLRRTRDSLGETFNEAVRIDRKSVV